MTIRSTKRLLRTKSTQLCEFFQEPIYNLETGEHYSSGFHQHAVKIALLLKQRWKLLAFTTTCLILLFTGSAVVATCRRLMPKPILKLDKLVADISREDVSIELSRYKHKSNNHKSIVDIKKEISSADNRHLNTVLDAESDFRNTNAQDIMRKRWDWVQANPKKYVNLMRKAGMDDIKIQNCLDRTCPLDFKDPAQYQELQGSLRELGRKLYKTITDAGVKVPHPVFRVIQQGSSIPGYSSNPRKGQRYVPNYLYDPKKGSDTDIRVYLAGLDEYVKILEKNGTVVQTKSVYPHMVEPNNAHVVFPELGAWIYEWQIKLDTEVQVTLNMKPNDPAFEPNEWDNEAVSLQGANLERDILTKSSKSARRRKRKNKKKAKKPRRRLSTDPIETTSITWDDWQNNTYSRY